MKTLALGLGIGLGLFTTGCSEVGPGLRNHPLDCAIGIAWADCLPGTPGYNAGGGNRTRANMASAERAEIEARLATVSAQCASELQHPDLDPIRSKIELLRPQADQPVPFAIASNDNFPTEPERVAIARWASLRDECVRRNAAISRVPHLASSLEAAMEDQSRSIGSEVTGRVGSLIVALYQRKLTFGEFAQARYEIGRNSIAADRNLRAAMMIADQNRQAQAQQLAQQQYQNTLMAFSAYAQAVSARQPQAIRLETGTRSMTNCISQRFGSQISTSCN